MRKLTIIEPDGRTTVEFHPKAELTLLQSKVDGLIERVPYFDKFEGRRCRAWVNEEGAINGMAFNEHATKLWKSVFGGGYELFGILVVEQKASTEELARNEP